MPTFTHIVPANPPNLRVDTYAFTVFDALPSRKQAKKAIRAQRLIIDNAPCRSAWFVRPGNQLTLTVPDLPSMPTLAMDLKVVHVDPWLAVVYKPAGIHVRGNHCKTIHRALGHNIPISTQTDALPNPEPVHRLDFRTQGLLIVARTATARARLGEAFQARQIEKRYQAVVLGHLAGQGELVTQVGGRDAQTRWKAVKSTRSLRTDWLTTVDLFPITGRTHQLRVHMTQLGHPILGDDLYCNEHVLKGCGLFLSAVELKFIHPITGKPIGLLVEPPLKFSSHIQRESRRWIRWQDKPKTGLL